MLADLPQNGAQNRGAGLKLDAEERGRQRLRHFPLKLNYIFVFDQVSTSGSFSVISTVCSKWHERPPSSVTTVQPSGRALIRQPPVLSIGSSASAMPALSSTPSPGFP